MPRLGPARAAARRQQIVDAAVACFARRGFRDTTMQDIVRASGLSPGAIYCHFSGKDEIILAVVRERHRRERALVDAASAEGSLADGLARLAGDFLEPLSTSQERTWREITIALWAESLRDRSLRKVARDGVDGPRTLLARTVRRAQRRREFPADLEPDAVARILIAVFQGLVLQQAWDKTMDVDACVAALKTLLLR